MSRSSLILGIFGHDDALLAWLLPGQWQAVCGAWRDADIPTFETRTVRRMANQDIA